MIFKLRRFTTFFVLLGMLSFLSVNSPCLAAGQTETMESAPTSGVVAAIFVSVKMFGAKGDGVSNDAAAVQQALDSLPNGGTLFFPKGKYVLAQTIVIPSNIRLLGEGKSSTVLYYQGNDKAIVSGDRNGRSGTGTYYVTVEHLTLEGTNCGTGFYATTRYLTLSNTTISHFETGIDSQFSWTNKFYNVSFFYDNTAFRGGSFLNANSFVNCIFSTGRIAVTYRQGWNVSFVGCQFEGYADACFSFQEDFKSVVWNLSITGCYFENNGRCIDIGPNCSFHELALANSIITTHGPGPAIAVNNTANYGKDTGMVENNTFFRDNNGAMEPFVHLEGMAPLMFQGNKGFATPGLVEIPLMDAATKENHASYEVDLVDSNRLNFSGTGAFEKGVIIGNQLPPTPDQGLLIYDNGELKIYSDAAQYKYLQTVNAGPSSKRPATGVIGMAYFDTTLGRPVWWTGSQWVDANGNNR